MIVGYAGGLVPGFFAERQIALPSDEPADCQAARAAFGQWRRITRLLGPSSSVRTIYEVATAPLMRVFEPGTATVAQSSDAFVAAVWRGRGSPIVVVTVPWGEPLTAARARSVLPAIASGAPWSLLFNGTHLRVTDAAHVYGRQHVEIDLTLAAEHGPTFAALWMLLRSATTGAAPPHATVLHELAARSRAAALDVCRALRAGVLQGSAQVTAALISRRRDPPLTPAFEQALTLIYRVLFLLFAEARGLVPMWHPVYRTSYSIDALRSAAEALGPAPGLWDALRAISRLAHAGCRLGELHVAPFNGRLFAPSRTPLVDRRDLDDAAARDAIVALTSTVHAGTRAPIPYRDLGVEQLGGVYETLLDYEPRLQNTQRFPRRRLLVLEPGSGRRKATGSFYTPLSIADYIVRRTLGPLVRGLSPEAILRLKVVDPAMGSGAFLVAACTFLAASYERALVESGARHATDVDEPERAAIRRVVAERCLYGVDLNPMAVQLARLSLWLATLASDRPLTFLDHHLMTGNSLVGAWLSAVRQPPPWRARRSQGELPLFGENDRRSVVLEALPVRFRLERTPDDSVAQVREKERALEMLTTPGTRWSRWKQVADTWCAPWFAGDSAGALVTAYGSLTDAIVANTDSPRPRVVGPLVERVKTTAAAARFFHWELEFPEVFFATDGSRDPDAGFDAVIGNPPWEMVRGDNGDAGARARRRLEADALVGFARESGFYPSRTRGHANQYQLFLERSIDLLRRGGRLGLVLPSGVVTDVGSAPLRKRLLSSCALDALIGFDNQRAIFPIHRSVRFLLMTATRGECTREFVCRFGERDVNVLDGIDDGLAGTPIGPAATNDGERPAAPRRGPVIVSSELLARISPSDLAIPDFRTTLDVAIVERAAALFPALGGVKGWSARFGRELNASDDRGAFDEGAAGLPVVEGKHVEAFRARLDAVRFRIPALQARARIPAGAFNRPRLCYRDVAGATNRMTLIAAILPGGCISTHTLFCLRSVMDEASQQFLCGVFNSFVANYLVRLRVGTHVTTEIIEALPIPTRAQAGASFDEIVDRARALSRRDDAAVRARLNAQVAALYQLSAAEFRHVLDTFPLVEAAEREGALNQYLTF